MGILDLLVEKLELNFSFGLIWTNLVFFFVFFHYGKLESKCQRGCWVMRTSITSKQLLLKTLPDLRQTCSISAEPWDACLLFSRSLSSIIFHLCSCLHAVVDHSNEDKCCCSSWIKINSLPASLTSAGPAWMQPFSLFALCSSFSSLAGRSWTTTILWCCLNMSKLR